MTEQTATAKQTVEDEVVTRVMFGCSGPYEHPSYFPARIQVYEDGRKDFSCDMLSESGICCKVESLEKVANKYCPFKDIK